MSTEIKTKTKRVKQVFGNMSEIAHIFANEPGRDCRFGSGYVEKDVIYSFSRHFPIAKRYVDKKGKTTIFFTLDTYTHTTSKHIRDVSAATRHLDKLYMPKVPGYYSSPDHDVNVVIWENKIEGLLKKAISSRENKEWYVKDAKHSVGQLEAYIAFFKLKVDKGIKALIADAKSDKWENQIEEYKKKKEARLSDPLLLEKQEKARKYREDKELRDNAEQIKKWRKFEVISPYLEVSKRMRWNDRYRNRPDLLRYDPMKDRMQTSQGVEIPVEVSKKFYRYIQVILAKGGCNSEECCNYKLLDLYKVTEVTEERIKVGCHTIKMDEVHNMAKQMNWI